MGTSQEGDEGSDSSGNRGTDNDSDGEPEQATATGAERVRVFRECVDVFALVVSERSDSDLVIFAQLLTSESP